MASGKKVPWRDWEEWEEVYSLMNTRREEALERLEGWKKRGSLPVVVECTRLLLVGSKAASGNCNFVGFEDVESTRLLLGMCILRVVNQVTDLHQKSKNAIPISAIAELISLPEYIVDVRHAATHGDLPPLFLLEKAIRDLYSHLHSSYWSSQWSQLQQISTHLDAPLGKYIKKAKHTSDPETLKKAAIDAFSKQFEYVNTHKEWLVPKLISAYVILKEESWVPLIAYLHGNVAGISEMCVEYALRKVEETGGNIGEVKEMVEAVVAVAGGMQLPVTYAVKRVLTLQNSNEEAYELVSFLVESEVFPVNAVQGIREIHRTAMVAEGEEEETEDTQSVQPGDMKAWTRVKYWSPKAIGSCTPSTR